MLAAPVDASPAASRRSALYAAMAASFVTPFMASGVNLALPSLGGELGMDAMHLSWVATAYSLAGAAGLVPAGRLADIWGRKRLYQLGMITLGLASLLAGLANSAALLIACRVLQGLGSSMIFATSLAIVTAIFPPGERGRALGLTVAAVYTGLSLGPFLGGLATGYLSWRWVFFMAVPLEGVAVAMVHARIREEWTPARGERYDLPGALIYGGGLTFLLLGVGRLGSALGMVLCGLGLLGLLGFVAWVRHVPQPVFDLSLFGHNRVFAFSSLAALISYGATFATTFLLSLHLQHQNGLAPSLAGLVMVAQPVVMALLSPLAGRLSDRLEPRVPASAGMALTVLGLLGLAWLGADTPLGWVVVWLLLLGLGLALFSSPNMNAIMGAVPGAKQGQASGVVGTMRLLGQMLSLGITTCVFALVLGPVPLTPATNPALLAASRTCYLIFAGLSGLGICFSLSRGNLRRR